MAALNAEDMNRISERFTLENVLMIKETRDMFAKHLEREWSSENLEFHREATKLLRLVKETRALAEMPSSVTQFRAQLHMIANTAHELEQSYIDPSSDLQVNLPTDIRKRVSWCISNVRKISVDGIHDDDDDVSKDGAVSTAVEATNTAHINSKNGEKRISSIHEKALDEFDAALRASEKNVFHLMKMDSFKRFRDSIEPVKRLHLVDMIESELYDFEMDKPSFWKD